MSAAQPAAVFAVDGGNSKAEALLLAADGRILAAIRSETISHQQIGLPGALAGLAGLAAEARRIAGLGEGHAAAAAAGVADVGSYCLAGADFPAEVRRLRRAIEGLGIATRTNILNDTVAALRAGATRPWGVALICGQGVNGIGVGPTGRTARFDALGDISGDWGGGTSVGWAGLGAAVRAADGRGPRTILRERVPAHYGVRSIGAVVRGFYAGRIKEGHIGELSPVVFAAAAAGDAVAAGIVERLAEELVTMVVALLRRTGQTRLDAEVILAGGVLQAGHEPLTEGVARRVRQVAPRARVRVLEDPPVLGAALLGLEDLGLAEDVLADAEGHLRREIRTVRFSVLPGPAGATPR